jgi:NUMOD3 motif
MPRESVEQLAREYPDRVRLRYGPYKTPRFQYDQMVRCEVWGEVILCGLSGGRVAWPIGKPGWRSRSRMMVVYRGLAKAVRRETELAVAYHWGVCLSTVTAWKKALGVPAVTRGTREAKREHFAEPWADETRAKAHAKLRDAARREKIAASKRGKPRPPHVIEAMREGRTGKPHSEEARRKMSEAQRRRGTRPPKAGKPWTEDEDEAVRTLPGAEAAEATGRTLKAVWDRRRELELPDGRAGRKIPKRGKS